MKKVFFSAFIALLAASSCSSNGSVSNAKLTNIDDSLAYAVGLMTGEQLNINLGEYSNSINFMIFAAANQDATNDEIENLMTNEEAAMTLQNYFLNVLPARVKAADQAVFDKVLKNNKDAVKTESGLIYQIIETGDQNIKASGSDSISVLYKGTYTDDKMFDGTMYKGNKPTSFFLGGVIKGWQEAIPLIGEGGKIKIWVPAELAYSDKALIFDIELVDVIKVTEE